MCFRLPATVAGRASADLPGSGPSSECPLATKTAAFALAHPGERAAGEALFERHARSVSLTDAGHAFLPAVRQALRTGVKSWISMRAP